MTDYFSNWGEIFVFLLFLCMPLLSGVGLLRIVRYAKRPERKKWLVVGLANGLVLIFLLSVLLVGFESYFRFVYDSTDSFGLTRTTQRWFRRHYAVNSWNTRDNIEYQLRRDPQKRRITFIGDSFTAGHGIANVEDRFVNRIRAAKPEWEVHVVASPGADTGAEYESLQILQKEGYEFDEVVLVYNLNDIADIVEEWDKICKRVIKLEPPEFLFEHSLFLDSCYFRFKRAFDPDLSKYYHFVRDAYAGPLWNIQRKRLDEIQLYVEKNGGRLSVVTFPFLHDVGPGYQYAAIHDQLNAFWKETRVPHLDLRSIYDGMDSKSLTVNSQDAHPSIHAHALAAKAICDQIDRTITNRSKSIN